MARLAPSVARVRTAVRTACSTLPEGTVVLVACSGGPDSMALAAACAFTAPRQGLRCGLVTVDHGLQDGSALRADTVADWARGAGFDPVEVQKVTVGREGGPEAAARRSRYAALETVRSQHEAAAVLLGHTRDDQAETVLLALSRGAGPHGLSGMPRRRGHLVRPLLELSRADTEAACHEQDLPVWNDPHNGDDAYARARVRKAMPLLTERLGEKLVANLARTATLVAQDNEALETVATSLLDEASRGDEIETSPLMVAPKALRTRVLRRWLLERGARAEDLSSAHIAAVEAMVVAWRGQRPTQVPGGLSVARRDDRLAAMSTR